MSGTELSKTWGTVISTSGKGLALCAEESREQVGTAPVCLGLTLSPSRYVIWGKLLLTLP